jgi:hypothetical protein
MALEHGEITEQINNSRSTGSRRKIAGASLSVFNPWLRLRFATANTNRDVVSRSLTLMAAVMRLLLECERQFRKADRTLQLVGNRPYKPRRAPTEFFAGAIKQTNMCL